MTQNKKAFLALLRVSLGSPDKSLPACSDIAWVEVFRLAEQHHVLPMVLDAAHHVYGDDVPWDRLPPYRKRAQRLTFLQTVKTERFLSLCRFLSERNLRPLVMKGLICRALYPEPDFRFSADEDLLIPPEKAMEYHEAFLAYGLKTDSPEESVASTQEIPYRSQDGVLFLEVHRFPFPPDSAAYGEYNKYFADVFDRAVTENYNGTEVRTMAPTDHLFYLICHAIKHFLHGGCGIRQVCDIGMFAQRYAEQIDWTRLRKQLEAIQAHKFAASFFAIAEKYLKIDLTEVPSQLRKSKTDPEAILEDILESGVYGSSTLSRKHSSTITLRAAENAGSGKKGEKPSRTRTLFPSMTSMERRYPYLEEQPWLLPVAWLQRIFRYLRSSDADNKPAEALRIGHERVSLMKRYGLLSDQPVKQADTEQFTTKQVDTGQYLSALGELIKEGHEVSIPIAGSSMTPFLGDGRDQIFVKAPWRTIHRGDVVLYRRKNGDFVLHRVHRVRGKGSTAVYDIVGDSQDRIERGIQRKQIIAVATRARRKGKIIDPESFYWRFFQHIWIRIVPLRRTLLRLYAVRYKREQ